MKKTARRPLIYENDRDDFWGIVVSGGGGGGGGGGIGVKDRRGTNHLGRVLESVRHDIEQGYDLDNWIGTYFKLIR